ncbi:MAG: hypothetical protein HKN44_10035, partial [Ilumatobacter sp.]|nr:hypothetical protein [Ilumatobacter sp.]
VGVLVDLAATLVLMSPGIVLMWIGRASLLGLAGLIAAAAGFGYAARLYARSIAATGKWFGNRVTNTEVVELTTGGHISVNDAAMRFVLRGLISPVLMFGFIVAFLDQQRRSFHDHAAGSIVTRPARATWVVGDD